MKKIKRLLSFVAISMFFVAYSLPLTVNAASEQGKWVLKDTKAEDNTAEYSKNESHSGGGTSSTTASYSPGVLTVNNKGDYNDEALKNTERYHVVYDYTTTLKWEEPPKEISTENIKDMKLTISGNIQGMTEARTFYHDMYIKYYADKYYPVSGTLTDGNSSANVGINFQNQNVSKEVFINKDNIRGENGDTLTLTVNCGAPLTVEYIYEYKSGTAANVPGGSESIDTTATETSGETPYTVPAVIAIGVLSTLAALSAASGAVGGLNSKDTENEEEGSTYKMYVQKDFGNKIRYDKPAVTVSARMVEVKPDGREIDRFDLTEQINIYSKTASLIVGSPYSQGVYRTVSVSAESNKEGENPSEAIICFDFSGEGGIYQNNMHFYLIGDPYIEYKGKHGNKIMVLSGSGENFELPFEPKDFTVKPECTIEENDFEEFEAEIVTDKIGDQKIVIKDKSTKPENLDCFMKSFNLNIVAKSVEEEYHSSVSVILCYEGLLADFAGSKKEVKGYYDRKIESMGETIVHFKLSRWNKDNEELEYIKPDELSFTYSDESGICEIIGLEANIDPDRSNKDDSVYILKAEKSFPNNEAINGEMNVMCKLGETFYEHKTELPLMPDIQEYENIQETEKEYENCIYMIKNYLPEDKAQHIINELESKRNIYDYGASDYRIYRKYVFDRAQYYLMVQHRDYMREAAFNDDMIKVLEKAAMIGGLALDAALMPIGGPLASFIIVNSKDLLIATVNMYQEKGEITLEGVMDYIRGALGGVDGVFSTTPAPTEYRKLGLWLCGFYVYRVYYRKYFDRDENKKEYSWCDAMILALEDLAIKAIMAEFVSRVMHEDQVTNKNPLGYKKASDEALMKPVTDMGDAVINKADSAIDSLFKFLDDIVDGKISLPW